MLTLHNYDSSQGDAKAILVRDIGSTSIFDTNGDDEVRRLYDSDILQEVGGAGFLDDLVGELFVDCALNAVDAPLYCDTDKEAF